ncbi:hypothetical protein NDU88_001844 [Pleurodeles waltl]|uniref:Myb/SANT-like DNA-binding domain-containing protein n=1 Tax=Pleurodeles waltl TaxID=8319 RepID=A0AAV7UAM0_PLEWA|nr:hypothetical protein NDU88_001844 [Pleurodeles waltl]
MAAASGERAPAFTAQELEKLVDGVLPQYTLLYGPPDQQVSAHQKRDIWRAIAKEVRTLGAHQRRGTHCRKRWEDICRCSKKTAEAQLGMASQRGRGARRTMTPLMFRILAVANPELDGRLRTSQQTQGGGEGPEEASPTCCECHGGEVRQHFRRSRHNRQHRRYWSGDHRQSHSPGGLKYCHWSGDHRQSHSPGGLKYRHWSGDHRQSHSPGGLKYRHWSGDHRHRRSHSLGGSRIVTGPETTARVTAQEGSSIVTGQETTARVIAQEGSSIVTGQETTARVTAQEGSSIVTGQETTARVIAQEGSSIVTGQETTATAGVTAQEAHVS